MISSTIVLRVVVSRICESFYTACDSDLKRTISIVNVENGRGAATLPPDKGWCVRASIGAGELPVPTPAPSDVQYLDRDRYRSRYLGRENEVQQARRRGQYDSEQELRVPVCQVANSGDCLLKGAVAPGCDRGAREELGERRPRFGRLHGRLLLLGGFLGEGQGHERLFVVRQPNRLGRVHLHPDALSAGVGIVPLAKLTDCDNVSYDTIGSGGSITSPWEVGEDRGTANPDDLIGRAAGHALPR